MADFVVLATDGSELALAALKAGAALLPSDTHFAIVTVMHAPDQMLVSGAGFAGGVATPEEFDAMERAELAAANDALAQTKDALTPGDVELHVLRGDTGGAICAFAAERGAAAIVIGSRGRGGIKRAFLGSVSDYIVRRAPCPVIVSAHQGDDAAPAT